MQPLSASTGPEWIKTSPATVTLSHEGELVIGASGGSLAILCRGDLDTNLRSHTIKENSSSLETDHQHVGLN